MNFFLDGMKIGVVLALMVGPLFFTLIQTGVEQGFRAGAMVGFGIWVSDFLYILAVYSGLSFLVRFVEDETYVFPLGVAGSALLILFGLISLLSVPQRAPMQHKVMHISTGRRSTSYFSLWFKGFLINTLNPFTIFFWMGLMSTVAVRDDLQPVHARYFFLGILAVVVGTDLLKVYLAKQIRVIMRPVHIIWLRRVTGTALLIFGIALLFRVW